MKNNFTKILGILVILLISSSSSVLAFNLNYNEFLSGGSDRFTFTGRELDDSGLMYYGARYYDPEIGKFTQPDTLLPDMYNPQALNRYSYVLNNPYKYTDPTGEYSCSFSSGCFSFSFFGYSFTIGNVNYDEGDKGLTSNELNLVKDEEISYEGQWKTGLILSAGIGVTGVTAASANSEISATTRGRINEKLTLANENLPKNTRAFDTLDKTTGTSVRTVPDSLGRAGEGIYEIKDTKYITQTRQLRAQKDLATTKGVQPNIITGTYTKASSWVSKNFNIIRRSWLGPKEPHGGS